MAIDKGEVVTCEGCSGLGYWRAPMGREHTCRPCGGIGRLRLMDGEVFCARCGATGQIESGIPGAVSYKSCPACSGKGRKRI
jgi:DnaJ-class molecular chaperone